MPLGTLDSSTPAFFKQGPSAVSRLLFFSAVSVLLMVADARFGVTQPLRASLSVALYPVQWLAMRPQVLMAYSGDYMDCLLYTSPSPRDRTRSRMPSSA